MIFYPPLALIDVLMTLIACLFVNWWAPLFATEDAHLPNWLAWFDTFDANLDSGTRSGYWGRVAWLYRNSTYGFDYWALGIPFVPTAWTVTTYTGDEHLPSFTFMAVSNDGHFNLHCVRFGLRFKFGWKAWNMYDQPTGKWKTASWGPQMRVPFVFSISIVR